MPLEVSLEILRHGKPHNQLLSPLTQYIGLSGQHEAVTVHVDLEHRDLLSYMSALRYQAGNSATRELQLGRLGAELGKILGAVPGLLTDLSRCGDNGLVHLRIISSAAELALLPFELIDAPAGFPGEGYPLSLQLDVPLVITREVRCAFGRRRPWPSRPKLLFVAANPPGVGSVPFDAHLAALTLAIESTGAINIRDVLIQVLPRATLEDLRRECESNDYTHVHILAHGATYTDSGQQRFGLALHGSPGDAPMDVVTADRLAAALLPHMNGPHANTWMAQPAVVSIATCDSGNQSQVLVPGSSLAHTLHTAGIPLVVASQFPLTKRGSVEMTETLYTGLLGGDDPRLVLHSVRQRLRTGSGDQHDWASLVAYTSLHKNIDSQLLEARYESSKRGIEGALDGLDKLVNAPPSQLDEKQFIAVVDARLELAKKHALRMPDDGQYCTEAAGMRASTHKRAAECLFRLGTATQTASILLRSVRELRHAWDIYRKAAISRMAGTKAVEKGSLHWVLCQYLSLERVLGNKLDEDLWTTAKTSARMSLASDSPDASAWSLGTLAELELLRVTGPDCNDFARNAEEHIGELTNRSNVSPFVYYSTARQFRRYVHWWSAAEFQDALGRPTLAPLLVETAAKLAALISAVG
jgi:hypothetical protein